MNVPRNTSTRSGCPLCGGINTLSITNENGYLKWYCFRASCHKGGNTGTELTLLDASKFIKKDELKEKEPLAISDCVGWRQLIPEYTEAYKYLEINNCIDAYKAYPQKFYFDAPNSRVVFCEYMGFNDFNLATGRTLIGEKPKWFKYIALPGAVFKLPNIPLPDRVFITEDCASACSLYRLGSAIALCGTTYNLYALAEAIAKTGAKKVFICLDNDARLIALRLRTDLRSISDFDKVDFKMLHDDAKYLSIEYLKKEFDNA